LSANRLKPEQAKDRLAMALFFLGAYSAGIDTTTNAITSTAHTLLTELGWWERVNCDESALRHAIEEVLRRDAPHRGLMRRVTRDTDLGGTNLHEGDHLVILFGAANLDPEMFIEPLQFQPGRHSINRHLAFGRGAHRCIGEHLARTEVRIAISALAHRRRGLKPVSDQKLEYQSSYFFRSLLTLLVQQS